MLNRRKTHIFGLLVLTAMLNTGGAFAEEAKIANVSVDSLPINASSNNDKVGNVSNQNRALVSPSKAQSLEPAKVSQPKDANTSVEIAKEKTAKTDAFDFDLKMKKINVPQVVTQDNKEEATKETTKSSGAKVDDILVDIPQDVQYKSSPLDNLGNNILSQMDDDLFKQMSEIEKSTTLLTLELKREKIRNEIEAQKAIRQKNKDDLERQKSEQRIKEFERKKQIEAEVLVAKQNLLDREKMFELLKQRKLLNAYMNQMLLSKQDWLKEKESLYAQLAAVEQEKKDLIKIFKKRIDKVLEASAKNIQVAEAAKTNFERVVKNLKSRNEQLRKRVEADAKIIKSIKNMYIQSQSLAELQNKNAADKSIEDANAASVALAALESADKSVGEEVKEIEKISSKYALLRISGRAGALSIEIIDENAQPFTYKVGSMLPTGHIVEEIGSDYAKFNKDGMNDYLYIGKTIDGYSPLINKVSTQSNN